MKPQQKVLKSPTKFVHGDEEANNSVSASSEEEPFRRVREAKRAPRNSNDFKVKIPEFEGELDLDKFLGLLHTVERVFDYKDIPADRKVKLLALRLRRYASLW